MSRLPIDPRFSVAKANAAKALQCPSCILEPMLERVPFGVPPVDAPGVKFAAPIIHRDIGRMSRLMVAFRQNLSFIDNCDKGLIGRPGVAR